MYRCNDCHGEYDELRVVNPEPEDRMANDAVCPGCGSVNIYLIETCSDCGEEIADNGEVCAKCAEEKDNA
jgi:predicted amidophosphoribosyltransferase